MEVGWYLPDIVKRNFRPRISSVNLKVLLNCDLMSDQVSIGKAEHI